VKKNPQLLHVAELDFFKDFLEFFGASVPTKVEPEAKKAKVEETHVHEEKVPPKAQPKSEPKAEPKKEAAPQPKQEEENEEPDPERIPPDNEAPLESGDESKEVTDEMRDEASVLKAQALDAQREGKLQESLDLFTKAIKLNPRAGLLYATRAQVLLDMKKPNAAIRDCDKAVKIAPDSAKGYKVRGKAQRALGNYAAALRDIQQGQKCDFDEDSHKLENELKPRADKIVSKKMQQERESREREQQEREREREQRRKQQQEQAKQQQSSQPEMPDDQELPPGVTPDMLNDIFSDPEMMTAMQDPSIMAKLQEIMQNPSAIAKYQSDPKLMKILNKFSSRFGGAAGPQPGAAPGKGSASFPFSDGVD